MSDLSSSHNYLYYHKICTSSFHLIIPHLLQLEKKQKQLVDSLRKADKHYCESCEKAEVARQEWDFTVSKVCAIKMVHECEVRIEKSVPRVTNQPA